MHHHSIKEIMTKSPACCQEDTSAQQIAQMMSSHDCGEIPVVDTQGTPIGVVTDRDLALRVVAQGVDPSRAKARDVMSSPVRTLPETSSLHECLELMEKSQIRRIPIVDEEGSLTGIVAVADVARESRKRQAGEVIKEISEQRQ